MGLGSLRIGRRLSVFTLSLGTLLTCLFLINTPTQAAAGVNQQINFQGRLLNSQGATVPDGYYNIEFKIYQDGDGLTAGNTTGSPVGSLKWTEDYLNVNTQGVTVKNGFLSVQLGSITPFGSSIDWNQDKLWLSLNIAGTAAACTPFSSCTPDGEMIPMKRLSATPYSLNSGQLGGLSSAQFVQMAQGVQTDASVGTNSIYINKTGSGNLLTLQSSGNDAFTLSNAGDAVFGANANHSLSVATAGAGIAGKTLTLVAGAAGSGGSVLSGGTLALQGGAGGGTNGNGGNVTIDAGVKNGTGVDGTLSLGTTTASAVTISKAGVTTTIGGALTVNSTVNGLTLSSSSLSVATAATGLALNAGTTGTVSIGGISTGDVLLAGGSAATGCTINNGNGSLLCTGTLNGATLSGGAFSGGTISGGTLSATTVNSLNVSANAISTASGNLTVDANTSGTVSVGGISTGDILIGGGSGATGCTITNVSGNLACTGTLNGATISGGTLSAGSFTGGAVSGGSLTAGTFSGGTVSGGTLSATAVNGLAVTSTSVGVTTAATGLTVNAGTTGTVSIGAISTGDILLGGGSALTGCTVANATGNFACTGTLNTATISGGTLSGGSVSGGALSAGTFSGGTVSGGSLSATAVNGLNLSSTALSVATAATGFSLDAGTTGAITIGSTSTGNILLGGGSGNTGCTINNGNGNLACDGTLNGVTLSGGTISGGVISGGSLSATAVNGLNLSSTALSVATAATGLTIDAGTTGTVSIGDISTGDILLGGGSGSTGCTVTNATGNFACTGTLNGATISGGTLSAGSFTGGAVSGGTLSAGTFSGGTVSGGNLTATTVNTLNVSANAISTAAGNLTVDANTTGTLSLGGTSTGDILLGGGVASTGCTLTNFTGALACTGTINTATISGGTLSGGNVSGGALSAGTFSGGTVSGGSLTANTVNGLNLSATALSVVAAATGLTVDAGTTGSISIGNISSGDIFLAGGSGSTGCTINNGNGNLLCSGSINGATLSGGAFSGGTISGGTLSATAVNSLNVSANAISTAAGNLTVDANTTGTVSLGATSTGDILFGGGSGSTGCTVTNATGALACTGVVNGATLSGGTVSGGTLTSTAVNGLNVSSTAVAVAAAATGLTLDAGTTGAVSIGATSTGDILLGGGSGSTGCTVTNATGNLTCSGNISAGNGITATGVSSLTGAVAGSSTALKITTGAATNSGLVVQGASAQSANLLMLQDSTGVNVLVIDSVGNHEQLGYFNTPYGGLGNYANLLLQSEAFDTAAWTKTSVIAPAANAVTSPDNTLGAETLVDSAAGGSVSQVSTTAPSNANYTFSVWLRASAGTQAVDLRIDGGTTGTGTKTTVTATTTWQRFSVTQNPNGFTGNIKTLIFPGTTAGSGTVNAWGAQLALGATPQVYAHSGSTAAIAGSGLVVNGNALFQSNINSSTAFLFQNASSYNVLGIDTSGNQLKVFDGTSTQAYISLAYNNGTSTGTIAASSGTTAIGSGVGAINVVAGTGAAVTMTANASSLWRTTAGTLTLQSGTASDLILTSGSSIVTVSGTSVVKLGQTAGDPGVCTAGAIVYNTTTRALRGCQGTVLAWNDLVNITTPTLQQVFTASTGGTTPEIKLDTTRGALDIQGDNLGSVATLMNVRAGTGAGLGVSLFSVTASGITAIQDSVGGALLTANGVNGTIQVGDSVAHSTNPITFALDAYQPATAGSEPIAADGAMYYNADAGVFRCSINGFWQNCGINNIESSYVFEDEFLGGTTSGATGTSFQGVGALGWNVNATTSCAVAYNQTGPVLDHNHPGTLRLTTAAATGNGCALTQAGTAAGVPTLSQVLDVGDVFKTNIALSSQTGTMRSGWNNQTSNSTPTSGAYWEYVRNTNATQLRYCYANNTTPVCANDQVIPANTWVELEIHINASNNITFVSNIGGTISSNTTIGAFDTGVTNKLGPTTTCYASTTTALSCYVDYIQWSGYNSSLNGVRN